jgi:acetoacetyl-CoA synthetase
VTGGIVTELSDIVWTPDAERVANANITSFAAENGFAATDYAGLHAWSIAEPEAFYRRLWDRLSIVGERGGVAVATGPGLRDTQFFPEARLNYAENCLVSPDDTTAIIAWLDDGTRRELTRSALYRLVSRMVQAMRAEGIGPGDRVAALVTTDIEAVALYLATSAVGAIWASCSPDFGPTAAADRLTQVQPVLLLAVPGYSYAGKSFSTADTIRAIAACETVRRVVLLTPATVEADYGKPHLALGDWLAPFEPGAIDFVRQGFDAPMAILFSSGTTGKPKAIIHSQGGLLLQHRKEQVLHCDLKPGHRLFFYSTCGWMMWNWLVSGLASMATIITYDGNPSYPDNQRMPDLIDAEQVAIFGTSAKFIDSVAKAGLSPRDTHSLASLRTVLSTGSPLLPQNFDYLIEHWKTDIHLASIAGGTDICGCFLGGVPTLPVRRGELQAAMLGMDVRAYSPSGLPVIDEPGELVCCSAHPSMPIGFRDDVDGSRYQAAYFDRFPGVWTHGDYVEQRRAGGFVIHGRSDTTLNPGGVRIGTAEIYRQVETVAQVLECLAVGQDWQGDQRIVLFVRLAPGESLTDELRSIIRSRIRLGATPRHVPARIVAVPDIPRTRSGKISELAVRNTIHGKPTANSSDLANAECLSFYADIPELRS